MPSETPQNKHLYYYQDLMNPSYAGWFGSVDQLRKAYPKAGRYVVRVCCPEDVPAPKGYCKTGRELANDPAERIPTMKDLVREL